MLFRVNFDVVDSIRMVVDTEELKTKCMNNSATHWYLNDIRVAKGVLRITVGGDATDLFNLVIEGHKDKMPQEVLDLLIEVKP